MYVLGEHTGMKTESYQSNIKIEGLSIEPRSSTSCIDYCMYSTYLPTTLVPSCPLFSQQDSKFESFCSTYLHIRLSVDSCLYSPNAQLNLSNFVLDMGPIFRDFLDFSGTLNICVLLECSLNRVCIQLECSLNRV